MRAIFGWGDLQFGQLGSPPDGQSFTATPAVLSHFRNHKNISQIISGQNHAVLITSNGECYTWGSNSNKQCGAQTSTVADAVISLPARVDSLANFVIVSAACGAEHTLFVTADGAVLALGGNETGQLGLNDDVLERSVPRPIKGLSAIAVLQVSCGSHHSLALTDTGEVYAFGSNRFGQLGLGDTQPRNQPQLVQKLTSTLIQHIACGESHSTAISASGAVWAWGSSKHGQCGLSSSDALVFTTPRAVPIPGNEQIAFTACGDVHTLFITAKNRTLLSCGSGPGTGHTHAEVVRVPTAVPTIESLSFSTVSCGRGFSAAVSADGRLFSWGHNHFGQLGQEHTNDSAVPAPVRQLESSRVVSVAAGQDHCFVLVSDTDSPLSFFQETYENSRSLQLSLDEPFFSKLLGRHEKSPVQVEQSLLRLFLSRTVLSNTLLQYQPRPYATFLPNSTASSSSAHSARLSADHNAMTTSFLPPLALSSPAATRAPSVATEDPRKWQTNAINLDMQQVQDRYRRIFQICRSSTGFWRSLVAASRTLLKQMAADSQSLPTTASDEGLAFLRVLIVLLANPGLASDDYDDVVSMLVEFLAVLPLPLQSVLVKVWEHSPPALFKHVLTVLNSHISSHINRTSSIDKTTILSVVVMSSLDTANQVTHYVPWTSFYNNEISTRLNLPHDYAVWMQQSDQRKSPLQSFAFCSHPFVLSATAKAGILHHEAAISQQSELIGSLFTGSLTHLFLPIRRQRLLADTLHILANSDHRMFKKPMLVEFIGEMGVDKGGVRKELFQKLAHALLATPHDMFIYNPSTRLNWFNPGTTEPPSEFELLGIVCGLAVYNDALIDLNFPPFLFKKLTGEPVGINDLEEYDPEVVRGLKQLLAYEGDVEHTFCRTFCVEREHYGSVVTVDLVQNGREIAVTNSNRAEFVRLLVDYYLNTGVAAQFDAFERGFLAVCGGPAFRLFRPTELELLLAGTREMDWSELRRTTRYVGGYDASSKAVQWFWNLFESWPETKKRKLLQFATGCDRAPVGGLANIQFVIQRESGDTERLPTASTCFSVLHLPDYSSREKLETLCERAITESEGFGLM
eukprot:TRINITY_DN12746_c0_g1_i1.p1 TRINITY_DN12746_c0_g1~~TRINITY_DN12746_c0_g1_i1.p1  ORF type:complete len:1102 (-),score=245.80 TRINITY_DN12746_c0_g1_i1:32-3277(-)